MAWNAARPMCRVALGLSLSLASMGLLADDDTPSYDSESSAAETLESATVDPSTLESADAAPVSLGLPGAGTIEATEETETEPSPETTKPVPTSLAPIDADKESVDALPLTTDAAQKIAVTSTEVIRERYPSTAVKVERRVAQDAQGNYFNHGQWTQFDEKGRMMGSGEYRHGKRHGKWIRWYGTAEMAHFTGPLYKDFITPFATEATFTDGVLHGSWKVFDVKNRKICEWEFENGERHGKSVWYFTTGQKRREVDYRQGEMDGEAIDFGIDGKVASRDKYIAGRRLGQQVDYHTPQQKRAEGWTLFAREVSKTDYSWWDGVASSKVISKEGVNQKRGVWTYWHKNGQKQMEGRYQDDLQTGKFSWWYSNGQKQLEGEYEDGKQSGKFVWWHPNGQKQCEGYYTAGVQSGKWIRWTPEGKVLEVGDYKDQHHKSAPIADAAMPLSVEDEPSLEAAQPPKNGRFRR